MPNDAATTRVLVWDDLDMRTALASVLVVEPPQAPEIDLEAVYLWLDGRCEGDQTPDAYLFTTVAPGHEADDVERVTTVRTQGFGVIVRRGRPDQQPVSLTDLLRSHLDATLAAGGVVELVVASHDGERLANRLSDIASGPVTVTVLGFRERALYAADGPRLRFVDLEDVPGAFDISLPRTNLYDLTEDGRALPALRRPGRGADRAPTSGPLDANLGKAAADRNWRERPITTPLPATMPSDATATDTAERDTTATDRTASDTTASDMTTTDAGSDDITTTDTSTSDTPTRSPWTSTESSPVPPWAARRNEGSTPSASASAEWSATSGSSSPSPAAPPPPPAPPAPASTPAPSVSTAEAAGYAPEVDATAPPTTAGASSVGALDDLLAGVQASPLTPVPPTAPRPGRVSPPNGSVERPDGD